MAKFNLGDRIKNIKDATGTFHMPRGQENDITMDDV